MQLPVENSARFHAGSGVRTAALVIALMPMVGCQQMEWFDPAALSPAPPADGSTSSKTLSCSRKGPRICVSCTLEYYFLSQKEKTFRVANSPSIALTGTRDGYALFVETTHNPESLGVEHTRIDHVRLAPDGTVRPATLKEPGDWKVTTSSGPVDVLGDSEQPAAASNGNVAAVVWHDRFCMFPQILVARFNQTGNNLGTSFGTKTGLDLSRLATGSVTNFCRWDYFAKVWWTCGVAINPSLAFLEKGWYGVAASVAGHNCSKAECSTRVGCTHFNVDQIHVRTVNPGLGNSTPAIRVSSSKTSAAQDPSLAWSGKELAVAWKDLRHDNPEIYFRRIKADGSGLDGPEVRVSNAPFGSLKPVLSWHGTGYGLAWEDARTMASLIYFRGLDAQGRLLGKSTAVVGTSAGAFRPDMAWDGKRYGLAWEDTRDGHLEVYFRALDSSGQPLSGQIKISDADQQSSVTPLAYSPRLAKGPTGEFGLAWIGNKSYTDGNEYVREKKAVYFARIQCKQDTAK